MYKDSSCPGEGHGVAFIPENCVVRQLRDEGRSQNGGTKMKAQRWAHEDLDKKMEAR